MYSTFVFSLIHPTSDCEIELIYDILKNSNLRHNFLRIIT